MDSKELEKWLEAGRITSQIMKKALQLAKPGVPLLEIAEKLEAEAEKLGVKWAFPVNLSINEIAAHYSPFYEDKTVCSGLLKIDLGISVDGYIADMARTVDFSPDGRHREMMKANEEALKNALKIAGPGAKICDIGKAIHDRIVEKGFAPVRNLSGHQLERFMIHAGINIPNYDNGNSAKLEDGVYAIEPFATTGEGVVQDGKPSGIYMLKEVKPVRDMQTRKILEFIEEEYNTLPFSGRWIIKKFGMRASISLRTLEQNGSLHHFSQLIEKSRAPVSQFEDSILIDNGKVITLTSL
jgi:methionyl aminopeptidase